MRARGLNFDAGGPANDANGRIFERGTLVKVHGLINKPEKNGCVFQVMAWDGVLRGRYHLKQYDTEYEFWAKPENITPDMPKVERPKVEHGPVDLTQEPGESPSGQIDLTVDSPARANGGGARAGRARAAAPGQVQLTEQQRAIVAAAKAPGDIPYGGDIVRVIAAAGTGKTTTIIEMAKRHLTLGNRPLYVVFNKSAQVDAVRRFNDSRVEVRTMHSLAWKLCGMGDDPEARGRNTLRYEKDMDGFCLQHFGDDIDRFLRKAGVDPRDAGYKIRRERAFWIWKTMNGFLRCQHGDKDHEIDDPTITYPPHPLKQMYFPGRKEYEGKKLLDKRPVEEADKFFCECAKRLWRMMKVDPRTGKSQSGSIMFDTVVKQAQLEGLTVGKLGRFCAVLVDESQDLTPCQLDWMLKQGYGDGVPRQVVFVGDLAQTIYGFRGAKSLNMLKMVHPNLELYLTESFRFKLPIAQIANTVIFCKKTSPQGHTFLPYQVRGASVSPRDSEVYYYKVDRHVDACLSLLDRCKGEPVTVLAWPNISLVVTALHLMSERPGLTIAVNGDSSTTTSGRGKFKIVANDIADVFKLYSGETKVLPAKYKEFCDARGRPIPFEGGWGEYENEVRDRELKSPHDMFVSVINTFKDQTLVKINKFKDFVLSVDPKEGIHDVLLTTVHGAKGLEWPNVLVIADQFPQLAAFDVNATKLKKNDPKAAQFAYKKYGDEINLWYVAVTRAQHKLVLPQAIVDVYMAFLSVRRIVANPDGYPKKNGTYVIHPYEEETREAARTYKDGGGNIIPQLFTIDELHCIDGLQEQLWEWCGVEMPPLNIPDVCPSQTPGAAAASSAGMGSQAGGGSTSARLAAAAAGGGGGGGRGRGRGRGRPRKAGSKKPLKDIDSLLGYGMI